MTKLKEQMKGTKEKSHLTLFPSKDQTVFMMIPRSYHFHDYIKDWGFLSYTKTREFVEPYIKIKPFSSAKFDPKKYEEDKEKVVDYYNSLGYRDAAIVKDTSILPSNQTICTLKCRLMKGINIILEI